MLTIDFRCAAAVQHYRATMHPSGEMTLARAWRLPSRVFGQRDRCC